MIPKKILLGTDFSENSHAAGDYAAEYSSDNCKVEPVELGTVPLGIASVPFLVPGLRSDPNLIVGTIDVQEGRGSDSTATQEAAKCW